MSIIGSILAGLVEYLIVWLARLIGKEIIDIRQKAEDQAINRKVIDDVKNASTLEQAQQAVDQLAARLGS